MPATDDYRWNQKSLHAVFAASSLIMLLSVFLMLKQDQDDEWRSYQRTAFDIDASMRSQDLENLQTKQYQNEVNRLDAELAEAQSELTEAKLDDAGLFESLDSQIRLVEGLELELKFQNSDRDEARANYDLAVRDAMPDEVLRSALLAYEERQKICDDKQLVIDREQDKLAELQTKVKQLTSRVADLEAEKTKVTAEADRVLASLENIAPSSTVSSLKRSLMELPIIDGFNSHLKVVQDWVPGLDITLGMATIARFDRCRTCHLNIDKTASGGVPAYPAGHPETEDLQDWVKAGEFPQPFSTHPNTDLYCSASSPHPVGKFGCTICHDGQGSGTSFGNAEHSPNDPQIADEWHHEYGFHPNHFWEYPMQPERFIESGCIKCHHSVQELGVHPEYGASAPKVVRGWQLIQKYGCYGCHEIHGYDGGEAIGPDLRVEPQTAEEAAAVAADPSQVAGKLRKVGPSLRHIAQKTTSEFIQYWTEIPQRYRPSTKMPQFFALHDHLPDAEASHTAGLEAAELAGIATVLMTGSEEMELLVPADGYAPDVSRGETLFTERGCVACHQHSAVPESKADFGPNISDIHRKLKRNSDDPSFSDWLYTWLREPERYHTKTRMPNLYLDAYPDTDGETMIDPAADITAFLLAQGDAETFPASQYTDSELDELVVLYLSKGRFGLEAAQEIAASGNFPQARDSVIGDEIVLATEDGSPADAEAWKQMKLQYVGKKTISRYGCYACHEVPGYEDARPIGVALQDWGRKDTSKLGFEHIEEYLHHHGEPASSEFDSTHERILTARKKAKAGGLEQGQFDENEAESELSASYFFDSLQRHGRAGFLWQKLRGPRSYDYKKADTKGYADRLRMPKFPLQEDEIEAIATFVLGLVAEPPPTEYVYKPDVREKTRIEGEFLLAKYNCTGCHVVELPKITFAGDLTELESTALTAGDHQVALEQLLKIRPPSNGRTGQTHSMELFGDKVDLDVASFHGMVTLKPDPEEEDPEFREYGFEVWEPVEFGDAEQSRLLLPGSPVTFLESQLLDYQDARGGRFAELLVDKLLSWRKVDQRKLAWQAAPPPLYQEGIKVQPDWLYSFLLEPGKIRYTTVLRMPRFNMTPQEARTLANYFAAVDGAEFPYEEQLPRDKDYLTEREQQLVSAGHMQTGQDYLGDSWALLNGPLCIKCHSVGSRKFKASDPAKDIQGPNLNEVQNRLRSDWVKLWLYRPSWITPYTSMPVNFAKNAEQFPDKFSGDPDAHVIAVRDALMNYSTLLEDVGPVVYEPPAAKGTEAAAGGED